MRYRTLRLAIVCLSTAACTVTQEGEGPASYYQPTGWLKVKDTLKADDFETYQSDITSRVENHRFIIDTDNAETEITLASPAEFSPNGPSCAPGKAHGIVILVHGLSDTAFSMRDLAESLATHCYVSRTLLLPGHGTVPGDLLSVTHNDWLSTVRVAAEQASTEHDNVVLIGFSLGAVLGLSLALEASTPVDALVSISPAFYLSAWRFARWAPLAHGLYPWIDRELPNDRFRYEAIPTRGVAEIVRAIRHMRKRVSSPEDAVSTPWMLVQSMDDAVTRPAQNIDFFLTQAANENSRALVFRSVVSPPIDTDGARVSFLSSTDEATQVLGLTHVAVHISPQNLHYGIEGDFRNCGSQGGRKASEAARCEKAENGEFDYGLWNQPEDSDNPERRAQARSAFNPRYAETVDAIVEFLNLSLTPTVRSSN